MVHIPWMLKQPEYIVFHYIFQLLILLTPLSWCLEHRAVQHLNSDLSTDFLQVCLCKGTNLTLTCPPPSSCHLTAQFTEICDEKSLFLKSCVSTGLLKKLIDFDYCQCPEILGELHWQYAHLIIRLPLSRHLNASWSQKIGKWGCFFYLHLYF